jgi:tRNA 2-thiocytidine biosynthesis protein TtcA
MQHSITWQPKVSAQLEKKLLHYTGKAISEFNLIEKGDKVLVCVSGGKDSLTMLLMLNKLRIKAKGKFSLHAFTLDQSQPGWDDSNLREWYDKNNIEYTILTKDTYSVVIDKVQEGKTYCGLCSRLRRGNIYNFAEKNGYNKIALGHHRDDAIHSLMMAIMYNGEIRSMPPKLLSDNKKNMVIRPLIYCQEQDIKKYSDALKLPIIPCTLCGSQSNVARVKVKKWLLELYKQNPKIPSNILHSLKTVRPSHLMDKKLWDFNSLMMDYEQGSL